MRIGIVGSRKFPKPEMVYECVQNIYDVFGPDTVIVSGGCLDSPDVWAEEAAIMLGMAEPMIFNADWPGKGKAAGMIRNTDIANASVDGLIAFWDGKSKGAFDTIKKSLALKRNVDIRVRFK